MPDSSDIDAALVARLGADATLLAMVPNGVYVDEAPSHNPPIAPMTRFVIVSLVDEIDVQQFGGRSYEDALYMVEARMMWRDGDPVTPIKSAAARIDVLLEDVILTVSGYVSMTLHRESRIRMTEVDEVDPSIRWYRRGGHYRVQMSVGAT